MTRHLVETKHGRLEGKRLVTSEGKVYFSFSGIPYAKPPQGNLRFKDPVPIGSWEGIKDATKEGGKAAQFDFKKSIIIGSDDCLYLNVFTPNYEAKNMPVMVMIHGGGFVMGSGNVEDFGPDYIVEQDTILVTFNYRLGVMGFLCTDPINARGDMGLKDQNMVLKWVQDNIAFFGGNPDNVTIFGNSAGSASVEYHILSPRSSGLFHKAIMQSGSVMNPCSQIRNGILFTERFAKLMGYDGNTEQSLFDFINSKQTDELVKMSLTIMNDEDLKEGILFAFAPVINPFGDYDGFLNEKPEDILKSGRFNKVATITGMVEREGMMVRHFYKDSLENGNYYDYLPSFLNKNMTDCDIKLKKLYGIKTESSNKDDDMINFFTDLGLTGGALYSLNHRLAHNKNDEYFYYFVYDGKLNVQKITAGISENGACHADELGYLGTSIHLNPENATSTDLIVKSRMVKMWTDFAKTGNPTPEITGLINEKWLPVKREDFKYLEIGSDLKLKKSFIPERVALWKELYGTV